MMKLLVPYVDAIDPGDARLAALAAVLGITSETVPLPRSIDGAAAGLDRIASSGDWCLVINPRVLEKWIGGSRLPLESVAAGLRCFSHLLLHAPRPNAFDAELITLLSVGHLRAVQEVSDEKSSYEAAQQSQDVCGTFAGLAFGMPASLTDSVFLPGLASAARRDLVTLRGLPFLTLVKHNATEILFLGSQNVAALDTRVDNRFLEPYFSRLAVPAMALRYVFAAESWRPAGQYACVIVDDPLLRRSYGFLKFKTLLDLMDRHRFHTSIAFIPHNWRRNSSAIVRMFLDRSDRLSICFHGNDHTGAEFASQNQELLDLMVGTAERRMSAHRSLTGLECARVMVFPQGKFSTLAMAVLKAHGFDAAVNTESHPDRQEESITLSDLIQPAVHRYEGFPLFLRDCSTQTLSTEIAFKLFFGRPVFIVEHHQIFRDPAALLAAVARINAVAPEINWVSVGDAVRGAYLRRRTADRTYNIRCHASTVQVSNPSASRAAFRIEWVTAAVVSNVDVDGGESAIVSLTEARDAAPCHLGFRRTVRGIVRRRLSEFRDNYLSQHPFLLNAVATCRRAILR